MGSIEHTHASNHDPRLTPPLRPDDDPTNTAAKLAAKRAKIRQSTRTFGTFQAAVAAKRAAAQTAKGDRHAHGFMIENGEPATLVERTDENRHFFINNKQAERYELIKQGSAIIVGLLRQHEQASSPDFGYRGGQLALFAVQRQLAFFDRAGNFHNQVILRGVEPAEVDSNQPGVKHTAVFEPLDTAKEVFRLPIDDIHCLSLAKPANNI